MGHKRESRDQGRKNILFCWATIPHIFQTKFKKIKMLLQGTSDQYAGVPHR
jgi:hypothetical protein